MKYNLHNLDAYTVLQERALADIHSDGYYLVHKKSGAKIVIASNDDNNKVFYIGFRTPPKDSTGVAHIIEHTVLCGSEKFPVKDPFIELLKGSMNTFLNAMTYPDKTVYPVASCNDKDFQNLMDVYMDAVLHPNIYKEQNIFRQEGWHYELDSEDDELTINGVVYNEMKGAYSSADGVLEREILNSLYPDTTYNNESGGDPAVIPELTYENYLDFHRTFYHPSNSYIYLYGDMDVEEKLAWLDQEYLGKYDTLEVDSHIVTQQPFEETREIERKYSISSSESEENNTYLSLNWSVGSNLDPIQYVAFDLLDYALLGSQGAPLKQALIDAGIGDDIYGGYDSGVLQPYFSVIAKNANPSDQERFCQIIMDVLKEQAEKGLNKKTLLAAINGAEFKFREADFGRIPKGLMFGLQLLDSWLYDDDQPFLHMDEIAVYEKLRQELNQGYFESLIIQYLLNNSHSSIVRVVPQKGLNAQKEQELQERLKAYRATLSQEEIQRLIDETHQLAAYQEEPSKKEDLDKIPLLEREDMKKVSDSYSNVEEVRDNIPYLWHDYHTNGILYLDYIFDIHHIPEEKLPYVGILKTLLGRLDTEEYKYLDLTNEINLYTGGIHSETNIYQRYDEKDAYQAKFEIRIRTLEVNVEKAIGLARSMMLKTQFTDVKRIYEILAQTKSRIQSELSESGNSVSASRALSYFSKRSKAADLLSGMDYYRVLEAVVADFEQEKEHLLTELQNLVKEIMQPQNLCINFTCDSKGRDVIMNHADMMVADLFENTAKTSVDVTLPEVVNEGFMDASQIQYVSLAGNYSKAGFQYHGAMRVFKTIMNYEYLWQNIRVRGGAYGCGCNLTRNGEMYFASYRDPNLGKTLDVYRNAVKYLESFDVDDRDMTRFVIGTFSEMDAPLTPISQGRRSMLSRFSGLTYEMIQKDRDEVYAATQEDIRNLAGMLKAVMDSAYVCAIGNEEKLQQESGLFGQLEYLVK